ncbi:hypothetical protein D3C71_1737290 [compost metagenome]
MQAPNLRVVATLRRIDSLLRQVVAQDVQRIDRVHPLATLFLIQLAFAGNPVDVKLAPGIEALDIDEVIAQASDSGLG